MKNENPTTEGATIHVPSAPGVSLLLPHDTDTHTQTNTHTPLPNGRGRYLCLEEHENCFLPRSASVMGQGPAPSLQPGLWLCLVDQFRIKEGVWEDGKG